VSAYFWLRRCGNLLCGDGSRKMATYLKLLRAKKKFIFPLTLILQPMRGEGKR
jgi:hypothetical protein